MLSFLRWIPGPEHGCGVIPFEGLFYSRWKGRSDYAGLIRLICGRRRWWWLFGYIVLSYWSYDFMAGWIEVIGWTLFWGNCYIMLLSFLITGVCKYQQFRVRVELCVFGSSLRHIWGLRVDTWNRLSCLKFSGDSSYFELLEVQVQRSFPIASGYTCCIIIRMVFHTLWWLTPLWIIQTIAQAVQSFKYSHTYNPDSCHHDIAIDGDSDKEVK